MKHADAPIPHRKNAAEWLMWLLLQPVGWALRGARMFGGTGNDETPPGTPVAATAPPPARAGCPTGPRGRPVLDYASRPAAGRVRRFLLRDLPLVLLVVLGSVLAALGVLFWLYRGVRAD